jgi:hypothetical protein
MRTTLSLDDDVAALLRRAIKARKASLKQVVNEALRVGLTVDVKRAAEPHRTQVHDGGRCLIGSLDCVAEALALAEGEGHR